MTFKKIINSVLLILLFTFSLSAMASTGRIVALSGDVKVNGQPMKKSYKVKGGDTITTGAKSRVNIIMSDKSVLDLQPDTKFMLEKFSFNKKAPAKSRSIMNLFSGSFRYISGLVGRTNHDNATIKMGTATAGIRGSVASFKFNGKEVKIVTIKGETTMTMGGRKFTFKAGSTGTGNTSTGKASSAPATGSDAKLVQALNDLKKGKVPKNLTDDELVLMMGAALAEGESLGISPDTLGKLVTQMVEQASGVDAKASVAAAASIIGRGTSAEHEVTRAAARAAAAHGDFTRMYYIDAIYRHFENESSSSFNQDGSGN